MSGSLARRMGVAVVMALMGATGGAAAQTSLAGSYLAARHAAALGDVEAAAEHFSDALKRDRENPRLMELATVNLMAAGRLAEAAIVAERLLEPAPQHRVGNLAIAAADIAAARYDAALERLTLKRETVYPLVGRLLEAWAAVGAGDREAAAAALDAVEDRPVFQLFRSFHEGLIRALEGDDAGAVDAFETARAALDGPSTRFALAHGGALERLGRTAEARMVYEEANAAALGDPAIAAALGRLEAGEPAALTAPNARAGAAEALFGVASVYANESGRRLAMVYAAAAQALRPDLAEASLLLAQLFEQEGRQALALTAYEAVPTASPYRTRAAIGRAGALQALDRMEAAEEALRALVATAPDSAEARVALGDLYRRTEQWEAGADAYGAAIELLAEEGRDNWALYYQRGICHERAGLWDLAEPDFRKALELRPEQPLVLNYLGYSLVEQRRSLEEAKAMIERAVELRPEDGYITDSLGWVLYRLNDFEGAVEWLERAVELAPYDPVINDHLGDAYWMVGRRLEAEFQWKRARSLEPTETDLERIKRKLAVGLDAVLAEEEAEAAAVAEEPRPNGG